MVEIVRGWPWYTQLAATLLPIVGFSMLLAKFARRPAVVRYGSLLGAVLLAFYAWSLWSAHTMAFDWVGGVKNGVGFANFVTVIIAFVASVFLFGGSMVVCQDLTAANGSISLRQGSLPEKVISWVNRTLSDKPIKDGQSLCKTSWIVIPLLIGVPIFVLVMYATVGSIVALVSSIRCIFTMENPLILFPKMFELDTWPGRQKSIATGRPWLSIGNWLIALALVWLAWTFIPTLRIGWFGTICLWLLALVAVWTVLSYVCYRLSDPYYVGEDYDNPDARGKLWKAQGYNQDFRPSNGEIYLAPFHAIYLVWFMAKEKLCPTIRIVK